VDPWRSVGLLLVAVVVAAGCLPAARGSAGADATGPVAQSAPPPSAVEAAPTSPSFVRPTPTPAPSFLAYTVKAGDNLNSIAHQFGTTGRSIAYWNGATYPSLDPESGQYQPGLLKIGWTLLLIPNATFDEQTLPEPSDLIDDTPSQEPDASDLEPSDSGG
jgi:hypothetical protein